MADPTAEADAEPIVLDDDCRKQKGHRTEVDCWDYFKKIRLPKAEADKLHRNYNAVCKSCGDTVIGQPYKLKLHMTGCNGVSLSGQVHALKSQASAAKSGDTSSAQSQQVDSAPLAKFVDKVRVTAFQKEAWWKLLCITLVNKNDAMELVSNAELVDLFAEYYESDLKDQEFLTNDKSCDGDIYDYIDFEHAAFTNPGVAAAVPTKTRAELSSNTEDYDIDNMISYD